VPSEIPAGAASEAAKLKSVIKPDVELSK